MEGEAGDGEGDRTGERDRRPPAQVAVMGMIQGGHKTSTRWGLDQVRETIRRFRADVVCAEIPPDHGNRMWSDFTERGVIEEDRVRRFPEYTVVLLDLSVEMGFTIVPCAAWTHINAGHIALSRFVGPSSLSGRWPASGEASRECSNPSPRRATIRSRLTSVPPRRYSLPVRSAVSRPGPSASR